MPNTLYVITRITRREKHIFNKIQFVGIANSYHNKMDKAGRIRGCVLLFYCCLDYL